MTRALLALAAVVASALAVYFALDEKLTPEAAAFLQPPRPGVLKEEENAWFMLVGLMARDDPMAYAREWTAAAKEVRTEAQLAEFERRFNDRRLPKPTDVVLRRYAELQEFKGLEEPDLRSPYSPLPYGASYGYFAAHEQTLERALIGSESFRAALKAVWQDTDLQRRMLAGSSYFISKAVFTVALARNYLAVSALLQANAGKAGAEAGALRELLSPLEPAELGLERPVASEVRSHFAVAREDGWLGRPNAAANAAARAARAVLEFKDRETYARVAPAGWTELAELVLRMQDLETLRRLVAFQAGLTKEPPAGVTVEGGEASIQPKSERFKGFGRNGRISVKVSIQSTQTRPTTLPAST